MTMAETPAVDSSVTQMNEADLLLQLIRKRRSSRGGFNPDQQVPGPALARILEAARWAPTPNNMQNFHIVVVDDPAALAMIAALPAEMSEAYLKENYALLSSNEAELRTKKVGTLARIYPRAWVDPEAWNPEADDRSQLTYLGRALLQPKVLLVVGYDATLRAPGSQNDTLGHMGLGCVLENMWLMAESLALNMHVLTVFSDSAVETEVQKVLKMAPRMKIAFACGLGYSAETSTESVRVRRDLDDFVHHNTFGHKDVSWSDDLK